MKVPYLKLTTVYQDKQQILNLISEVIDSGWYILGKNLEDFEQKFANYCNASYCIGVGNGLDALRLILIASNIGTGDRVIVPANTYVATILAVTQVGATPILVEPNPKTLNIDHQVVKAAITPETKAILAVHLYGYPAPMDKLQSLAQEYDILLLDDVAQAHGAIVQNNKVGAIGQASAFSFFPTKNLGCLGDGGAITTSNSDLAHKLRLLRNYGSGRKYFNDLQGINSRLDEMQAAILKLRLHNLDRHNQERRRLAQKYITSLSHLPIAMLPYNENAVYHIFPILSKDRDKLQIFLQQRGVETLIHYPVPPHQQKCYQNEVWAALSLPITERIAKEELSLPLYPGINEQMQDYVIETIREFYER